ncbi:MAG: RNase H-like domain-containing protein, partial [Gammaproteobacteria bacterium]|nr:RNase H-like domain-containing protein [Gammaproteobacteria bacterium]
MGLDRPLRKQVMLNMKDGDTVQSLLQIAKRVEQIDETEQKVEKAVRRVEGLEDAQTNQEITALSQQLSAVQAQVNRISGRRKGPNELGAVPKDRRICWTCGGDDHLRRNCPYNRRGRPSRGRGELICWTCGNPGHRRADCAMNQKPSGSVRGRNATFPVQDLVTANAAQTSILPNYQMPIVKTSNALHVPGLIGDQRVNWLVDTGAEVTLASSQLLLNSQTVAFEQSTTLPVSIDGSFLKLEGTIKTDLEVAGITLSDQPVYIIKDMSTPCILGMDTLKRLGDQLVIDWKQGTIKIGNRPPVRCIREQKPGTPTAQCYHVSLCKDVIIPGRHEIVTTGTVKTKESMVSIPVQEGIIEPTDDFTPRTGLGLARTLISVQDDKIPVRLCNPSDASVHLYAGMKVGYLEPRDTGEFNTLSTFQDTTIRLVSTQSKTLRATVKQMIANTAVTNQQRDQLETLLIKHGDVFSIEGELGHTKVVKHTIPTSTTRPLRSPPRRIAQKQREEINRQVDNMLQQNVIRPSTSPWSSPIVLVPKKDGSARFCVDYRRLNSVTEGDAYPLPRIDDCLDALGGAKLFTTLDLASGYWQVEMDEDDRAKTAFTTHHGLYEFNRMPFGLKGAPQTFQRLMAAILGSHQWETCLLYLDDIIIFSQTFEQHLHRLESILIKLKEAGLKLKPVKCSFLQTQVKFLGHVVSADGVAPDPLKVQAVATFPRPQNLEELRRFLGMASYFRKFIRNFASVACPLHRLTEKSVQFQWTSECQQAFTTLKQRLTEAPVLCYPDFTMPFLVYTDASGSGLGAVLCQKNGNNEQVVAYASRTLTKAERHYSTTERECLGVVWAVKQFRVYLYGRRFLLCTDHNPLVWLRSCREPKGRLARWVLELEEYDYEMKYQPGTSIPHADALSRTPCTVAATQLQPLWSEQEIVNSQRDDPDIKMVLDHLRLQLSQHQPNTPKTVRHLLRQRDHLQLDPASGILYCLFDTKGKRLKQLLLPKKLVPEVLSLAHDHVCSGHLGVTRTVEKVRQRFYWPTMFKDITNWCRTCDKCGRKKMAPAPQHAPLQSMPIPQYPWQWVSTDIVGPFPCTKRGNKYVLTVTCGLTKWVEAFPIPNQEAQTVANILVNEVICRYGVPETLHSDQGTNFESSLFQEVCKQLGIHRSHITPYHPQGNGQVERFNRSL